MRIELIHPKEIGVNEAALWRAHQSADASLKSPFLTPDWARLMGEVRPHAAQVAVLDDGRGFLPVQRLSSFSAMGLGAPIADYQGVVGEQGLRVEAGALCRALKVGRIDLSHVPETNPVLKGRVAGKDGSWIVDVTGGAEAYRAGLKERRNDFFRQQMKKERKFIRERGQPVFTAANGSRAAFETMLSWKLAQLKRTGQPAIWANPWVREALDRTFVSKDAAFSGVLFTLTLGENVIAANYFLRSGDLLHDWIMAHDDTYNAYSPGVMLGRMALEWAADHGFAEVDFGPGPYQYKRQLSTGQRQLAWGSVSGVSLSGAVRLAEYGLRAGFEKLPNPKLAALPGKAMRKLDLMRGLAA